MEFAIFLFTALRTWSLAQRRLYWLHNWDAGFSFLTGFTLDIIFVCEHLHPCGFIWLRTVIVPPILFIS